MSFVFLALSNEKDGCIEVSKATAHVFNYSRMKEDTAIESWILTQLVYLALSRTSYSSHTHSLLEQLAKFLVQFHLGANILHIKYPTEFLVQFYTVRKIISNVSDPEYLL